MADPPDDLDPTVLPGVLLDGRVGVHRAPGWRYAGIRSALTGRGVRFSDDVENLTAGPGNWRKVELRPYQEDALVAWRAAGCRGVVVLPTGSGKTRIALAAAAQSSGAVLCLVPTRVLLDQWRMEMGHFYTGEIGCFGDGERRLAWLTVATFESAWRNMDRLGNRFSLIVIDEVHHFGSGLRDEALEMSTAGMRLGLTATPPGEPGRERLDTLVGPVAFALGVADLAGDFLARFRIVTIEVELDLDERVAYEESMSRFRGVHGAFVSRNGGGDWKEFVREAGRTEPGRRALAAWRHARRILAYPRAKRARLARILHEHPTARILIFTGDNDTAYTVAREHLVMPLTCHIGRSERESALTAFREGRLRTLVSAQVLNEGLDVPDADLAVIVAGRLGQREYVQRVGRLLRPTPGKTAVVYELVVKHTSEVRQVARKRQGLAPRRSAAG